ncbi:MAG: hypothetical protein KAI64_01580, partial [Thermoplasmata archaeon]|nr:hypothetical protein [Thermoplasmata archaeon]
PPERHYLDPTESLGDGGGARPMNLNSTVNHRANKAWENNFTGSGVNIAVIDDSVDFAHPDLKGTEARVEDLSSPYYGWPIAFDPYSMSTYLSSRDSKDTWYSSTNTTNKNVTHTIRMDGTNDFWLDGSELVAADVRNDIISNLPFFPDKGNDYDLVGLYVTQDLDNWYIGIESFANQTNMTFGVYINTTLGGATYDPLGNYVNATDEHRPEFAIYIRHRGLWTDWSENDTLENATIHKWDETGGKWFDGVDLIDPFVGGEQSYSGWKPKKLQGFIELKVPKNYMKDDGNISIIAFTTGWDPTMPQAVFQPQDCVDTDPVLIGRTFPDLVSTTNMTLSSFTVVGSGFWKHTYKPVLPIAGRLNVENESWPTQYIVTGTSKSGTYYFGNIQDENYPQTRVLVVDEAVADVYDTVYVDLDHDKDFGNDKPNKKLGKYDSQMVWHEVNWTGIGTIYDETVYADYFDYIYGITSLDFSPNGSYLASGSNDHTVILWRVSDYSKYKVLNAHMGRVTDVEFSPNGNYVAASYDDASGGSEFNVVVWDFATGAIDTTFTGHNDTVTAVAWSPTGNELVSSSLDGTVKIWDFVTKLNKTFD